MTSEITLKTLLESIIFPTQTKLNISWVAGSPHLAGQNSHKTSGKIKTSQEIKYIMVCHSWNIIFESDDAAQRNAVLSVLFPARA